MLGFSVNSQAMHPRHSLSLRRRIIPTPFSNTPHHTTYHSSMAREAVLQAHQHVGAHDHVRASSSERLVVAAKWLLLHYQDNRGRNVQRVRHRKPTPWCISKQPLVSPPDLAEWHHDEVRPESDRPSLLASQGLCRIRQRCNQRAPHHVGGSP